MKNHGKYSIYLTGSKKRIERTVYEDEYGKCYVKWYGNMIEVKRSGFGYSTVDKY